MGHGKGLERVSIARTQLIARCPFFGHLTLKLRPRLVKPGAGVRSAVIAPDGTLVINEDFLDELSPPQVCYLLAHTVMHPALLFFDRRQGRHNKLWNCFPAGTLVGGPYTGIESLTKGQELVTASGMAAATESVTETTYDGKLFEIGGLGLEPIRATSEHPFLVVRRLKKGYPIKLSEPYFEKAENIHPREHYLAIPRVRPSHDDHTIDLDPFTKTGRWGEDDLGHNRRLPRGLPINRETAWLMGLYIAEGDAGESGVRWTIGAHEPHLRDKLIGILTDLGFSACVQPIPERHGIRISCGSSILARAFAHHFGSGAHSKQIGDVILYNEDLYVLGALLDGYTDGDGFDIGPHKDGIGAATVSRKLAQQVQLGFARMGRFAKVYHGNQRDRYIRETFIPGGASIWRIEASAGRKSTREMPWGRMETQNVRHKMAEDFIFTPVKEVKTTEFTGPVFNIATPDHTYAVNNAVVHNCAHDHAINLLIKEMTDAQCVMLPGTVVDDRFKNWSAEEIYDDLLKDTVLINLVSDKGGQQQPQPKQQPGKGKKKPQKPQPGQNQNPFGSPTPEQQKGPGSGGEDNQNPTQDPLFGDCDDDACDSPEGQKASEGDASYKHHIEQEWKTALVSSQKKHEDEKGRGTLPLGLTRWIDELLEPKIDWKERLSRFLGEHGRRTDYTYQRPGRRSESVGEYMPSVRKFGIEEVTVLMDTSGSIDKVQLREGCSEIQGICEDLSIAVRVMVVDAAIHNDLKIDDAFELMSQLAGGGGSDFCPAFDMLQKEGYNGVVIAFTDGMIGVPHDKPEQLKACLWVTYKGYAPPTTKWGEHLEIPPKEEAER